LTVLLADEEKARLLSELTQINKQLEEMASSDALTRVHNRRAFDVRLSQEWRRAAREETEISLLMMDVDRFKLFNDTFGHQTGDDCLYRVAQGILRSSRRPGDIVCRYGGEEFAVILPNTGDAGAAHVANCIREGVASLRIQHPSSPVGFVTVSIGCATARPKPCSETAAFIYQADKALFEAKREGRNRVVSHAQTNAQATDPVNGSPKVSPIESGIGTPPDASAIRIAHQNV
jgi:diguanylate cyclase (GGDEF)-like protein